MGKDTGHGATLTLSSTGSVGAIMEMTEAEEELEKVEDTDLSSSKKTYLPGDVPDQGEFEVTIAFDNEDSLPALGVVETVTVTAPQQTGQTAAANTAGTGFIRKRTIVPGYKTNALQIVKLMIAFDGKTGPTFTAATTA